MVDNDSQVLLDVVEDIEPNAAGLVVDRLTTAARRALPRSRRNGDSHRGEGESDERGREEHDNE